MHVPIVTRPIRLVVTTPKGVAVDFADSAAACTEDSLERGLAMLSRRSDRTFLAIALCEDGTFLVKSGTSAAGAMLEIPDDLLEQGSWLVTSHERGTWSIAPSHHQFSCLSDGAMLQLAKFVGQRWLRSVDDCMSRHPAGSGR